MGVTWCLRLVALRAVWADELPVRTADAPPSPSTLCITANLEDPSSGFVRPARGFFADVAHNLWPPLQATLQEPLLAALLFTSDARNGAPFRMNFNRSSCRCPNPLVGRSSNSLLSNRPFRRSSRRKSRPEFKSDSSESNPFGRISTGPRTARFDTAAKTSTVPSP